MQVSILSRFFLLALGGAFALALGATMSTAGAASPVGVWQTGGGKSHIEIYKCGSDMCGKIVWLKSPNGADGKPARDRHNPDASKRNQPVLGLQILSGLKPSSKNEWKSGRIYDPENGKTFGAQMTLASDGTLKIRGYEGMPMLGETRTWTRVK